MSILSNTALASAISDCDCSNCESINRATDQSMDTGAIFVVPIHGGGSGVNVSVIQNIIDTLEQISEENASTVNGDITTPYEIISKNGYPT